MIPPPGVQLDSFADIGADPFRPGPAVWIARPDLRGDGGSGRPDPGETREQDSVRSGFGDLHQNRTARGQVTQRAGGLRPGAC